MGLYDMILVKDNHVDYAGGMTEAIANVAAYFEGGAERVGGGGGAWHGGVEEP